MGHGEHEGHGAGMVRDFLRRLVVSTILSLPLIIFSPAGAVFGLPSIPPFNVSMGLLASCWRPQSCGGAVGRLSQELGERSGPAR